MRSRYVRFFDVFSSGTFSKNQAGLDRSASLRPMEQYSEFAPSSNGSPSTRDQIVPSTSASSQSKVMLPIRADMASSQLDFRFQDSVSEHLTREMIMQPSIEPNKVPHSCH